jgi:ASTRA-associated protein 1
MSTFLPVEAPPEPRKQPWVLHILEVNTMNFCSFAQTALPSNDEGSEELLIAVPNTMSSETVRYLSSRFCPSPSSRSLPSPTTLFEL